MDVNVRVLGSTAFESTVVPSGRGGREGESLQQPIDALEDVDWLLGCCEMTGCHSAKLSADPLASVKFLVSVPGAKRWLHGGVALASDVTVAALKQHKGSLKYVTLAR